MKDFFYDAKRGAQTVDPDDRSRNPSGESSPRNPFRRIGDIPRHPFLHAALTLIPLFLSVFLILHLLESRSLPMNRFLRPVSDTSGLNQELFPPAAAALRESLSPLTGIPYEEPYQSNFSSHADLFFAKRKPSPIPSLIISGPAPSSTLAPVVFIIGFDHGNQRSRLLTMTALENLFKTTSLRNLAFEFSSDLQDSFNKYYYSPKRDDDREEFARSMIAHCPLSIYLNERQKVECTHRLLATESIKSVLDIAALASRYKATVVLVDTPMATVSMTDPMISSRNQIMAKNVFRNIRANKVIMLVGSAHTGHGDLGLSLDDRLTGLGARTLSINVDASNVPLRREWGTNRASADFRISDPMELASLITRRYPGM